MFTGKVCVVGGGPAGLAAAIALSREKCHVTVVDCAVPPVDKACGEGLMPDSVAAMAELGIEIPGDMGFAFRGIRFSDAGSSVFAEFPNGIGRGVRRTVLHELLIQHAYRLGVLSIWNAKHVRLAEGGILSDGRFLEADLIIGADGQNSQIRRHAGLDHIRSERRRYGFRRHYRIAPWSSYTELHWGARSQIYITPLAEDEICVAVISDDPRLRLEQALCGFPEVRKRLKSADPVSPEMGALSGSRALRHVRRGNVALIGDASGSVDAITGEGMCLGFKQALALARAVKARDTRQYEREHQALMNRPQTVSRLMLMLQNDGRIQRRALTALAKHPEIFKSFLAIHVGSSPFRTLCSRRLLNFGWACLRAA